MINVKISMNVNKIHVMKLQFAKTHLEISFAHVAMV